MLSISRVKYYLYGFLCYFIDSLLFLMPREIRRYKGVIFLIILLEGKKLKADPGQDKTLHIDPVTDKSEYYDQDNGTGKSKNFLTENHNKTTPLLDYREGIGEEYIYYGLTAVPYEGIDIKGVQNFSQGYQFADNGFPVLEIFTGDVDLKKEVIPKILKKEVINRLQQNNNSQDFVKSIGTSSEQDYSPIPKYQAFEEPDLSGTVEVQETPQIEAESEQPYLQDFISDSIDQLVIHYQDLEDEQTGEFSRALISEGSIRDLNQFRRENSFSVQLIREDSSLNLQKQPEIQDGNTQYYKNALKILIGGSIIIGGFVVLRNLLGDDADAITTDLETTFVTEEII